MSSRPTSPSFERAILELFGLLQETTSLKKKANKAVLAQKTNDLRAVHAQNSDMLATDLLKPLAALMKLLENSGVDCDTTALPEFVEKERSRTDAGALYDQLESVGHKGVTVPNLKDELGQIHIMLDPTASCYRFTNLKDLEDPIPEGFMFYVVDIQSVHFCNCDFHLDTVNYDINIRMSHEAAAKAFTYSLSRALKKSFVSSVSCRNGPAEVSRDTV
ncbi:MAG: hypothetical protein Q9171_006079 [Xanthocarpia ochracea]